MTAATPPQPSITSDSLSFLHAPLWPGGSDAQSGSAWDALQLIQRALGGWIPTERAIRGDTALTPLGVSQKLAAESGSAVDLLTRASRLLDSARTQVMTLQNSLLGPASADALEQGRQQEIRAWLLRMAPEDRRDVVVKRLAVQDLEFARSVYFAPASFELVDADVQSRIGEMLLRQADPRKYLKLKLLSEQVGVVEGALERAEQRIKGSIEMSTSQAARRDSDEEFAARTVRV